VVGERVTVDGFVDDDPGRLQIYTRWLIRENGDAIRFEVDDVRNGKADREVRSAFAKLSKDCLYAEGQTCET
jgi:hypothetical protein